MKNENKSVITPSPLARFVIEQMEASKQRGSEIKPAAFCKKMNFDRGLFTKILLSRVKSVNFESALKLALGFDRPPQEVFRALGRDDEWGELLHDACERAARPSAERQN